MATTVVGLDEIKSMTPYKMFSDNSVWVWVDEQVCNPENYVIEARVCKLTSTDTIMILDGPVVVQNKHGSFAKRFFVVLLEKRKFGYVFLHETEHSKWFFGEVSQSNDDDQA